MTTTLWLDKNTKKFRIKRIKGARRNSLLLEWLKFLNMQEKMFPRLKLTTPVALLSQLESLKQVMQNYRRAIAVLLKAWPEQARISDFKGQTPLMLVATNGDAELTKLLIPFSDVNARDYLGRTALHSAVMSNSSDCVFEMLECENIDVSQVTNEGNNALHMSVRFGLPAMVQLTLNMFPGLVHQENAYKETPQLMAVSIYKNFSSWQRDMKQHGRHVGSKADYEKIISMLEGHEI